MNLHYQKLSGAGNTFILLDRNDLPAEIDLQEMIRITPELCSDANEHGGADGMIVVEKDRTNHSHFIMHYFNRDGSTGMMCGNGGRCAVRFAVDHGLVVPKTSSDTSSDRRSDASLAFTNAGVKYHGMLTDEGRIRLEFPDPIAVEPNREVEIEGKKLTLHFVDVGTPHLIMPVDRVHSGPVNQDSINRGRIDRDESEMPADDQNSPTLTELVIDRWGPLLRRHQSVMPGGANANFIERRPADDALPEGIALRTFERGVEGETGACGTGAIASGLIASLLYDLPSPVAVVPTSGSPLFVGFRRLENGSFTDLSLEGGADVLREGSIEISL